MPTIRDMVETFKNQNEHEYRDLEKFLLGKENYSLVNQDSMIKLLDKKLLRLLIKKY